LVSRNISELFCISSIIFRFLYNQRNFILNKLLYMPNFDIEDNCKGQIVIGVDEAGRAPLAGPVVAGAVIIDRDNVAFTPYSLKLALPLRVKQ
jgi:ribonuclease HIII